MTAYGLRWQSIVDFVVLETSMKRDGFGWPPPPLPDDPAERRKIGIRLVILAALGVVAQIISTIAAW